MECSYSSLLCSSPFVAVFKLGPLCTRRTWHSVINFFCCSACTKTVACDCDFAADLVWVWLSRVWSNWRSALRIVKPETVIAWHRQGFRLYWKWKSRVRHGRPSVPTEIQNLIQKMSFANPRWGAPRIHGELQKLGIHLAQATVANTWFATASHPRKPGGPS